MLTMNKLLAFQQRFLRAAFAPDIEIAALSLPRGNAKSTLAARLLSRSMRCGDPLFVEGADNKLIAGSHQQARVVQSPGCREIYSDAELGVREGDIVIDSGEIAASLGYDPTDPDANKSLLRVASRMRGIAIVEANDSGLSGIVRTSNPRHVPKLLEKTGTLTATVIPLTRAEACRRIRRLFPDNRERAALCEAGLDRYFNNE